MRATQRILLLAAMVVSVAAIAAAQAQASQRQSAPAKIERNTQTEISSQARRRPRPRPATRLRVYRERLPANAVRTCDAWYVQEFRPSGPVIVPRMRCRWIAG